MTHERLQELVSDLIDGGLDAETRRQVEEHLARCEDCRAARDDFLALKRWAHDYQAPPAPSDPWPAVVRAISPRPQAVRTRWRFALAASLLLVGAIAALRWWTDVEAGGDSQMSRDRPAATEAHWIEAALDDTGEKEFLSRVEPLERILAESGDRLDPRTREAVERSLRDIDAAIERAVDALRSDPSNGLVLELLARSRQQKIQLLRSATEGA